jgi:hypothetical protein
MSEKRHGDLIFGESYTMFHPIAAIEFTFTGKSHTVLAALQKDVSGIKTEKDRQYVIRTIREYIKAARDAESRGSYGSHKIDYAKSAVAGGVSSMSRHDDLAGAVGGAVAGVAVTALQDYFMSKSVQKGEVKAFVKAAEGILKQAEAKKIMESGLFLQKEASTILSEGPIQYITTLLTGHSASDYAALEAKAAKVKTMSQRNRLVAEIDEKIYWAEEAIKSSGWSLHANRKDLVAAAAGFVAGGGIQGSAIAVIGRRLSLTKSEVDGKHHDSIEKMLQLKNKVKNMKTLDMASHPSNSPAPAATAKHDPESASESTFFI